MQTQEGLKGVSSLTFFCMQASEFTDDSAFRKPKTALLSRIEDVTSDINKTTEENDTLQTYLDNMTRNTYAELPSSAPPATIGTAASYRFSRADTNVVTQQCHVRWSEEMI